MATDTTNPSIARNMEKCAVLAMLLRSRFRPPSNMIMISATAAKYGTICATAAGCTIPRTGPRTTPRIIRNATSGTPVLLKNASPVTPRNMTTPAASRRTGADATASPDAVISESMPMTSDTEAGHDTPCRRPSHLNPSSMSSTASATGSNNPCLPRCLKTDLTPAGRRTAYGRPLEVWRGPAQPDRIHPFVLW